MSQPTLLITGAAGFVGGHVLNKALQNWKVIGIDTLPAPIQSPNFEWRQIDLLKFQEIDAVFRKFKPSAVIHTAAMSDIDKCETNPQLATEMNVAVPERLARLCQQTGAKLVFTSTDTVFDGSKSFYTEEDDPKPLNHYGRTKLDAERSILSICPRAAVARLSLVAGLPAFDHGNSYIARAVRTLRAGDPLALPADEFRTPIFVETLAEALLELAGDDHAGIFHLAGNERLSRYDSGVRLAIKLGFDTGLVVVKNAQELHGRAPRPKDVSLSNHKARSFLQTQFLSFDQALARMFE